MPTPYEPYLRRYLNDNGKLWTSDQIERWAIRAEQEICKVFPSVTLRVSLPIIQKLPLYTIPTPGVLIKSLGINQITWKGRVLIAITQQQAFEYFPFDVVMENSMAGALGAFSAQAFSPTAFYTRTAVPFSTVSASEGEPQFWAYSGYREDTIQLFPAPNETLPATPSNDLWGKEIPNRCIVEYRTMQYDTDHKPLRRLTRMLIRDYVLSRAFALEGKGQQVREAEYCEKRFNARLDLFKALASNMFVSHKHQLGNQTTGFLFPHAVNYGNDIGIRVRR